jgi:hypothetical protein
MPPRWRGVFTMSRQVDHRGFEGVPHARSEPSTFGELARSRFYTNDLLWGREGRRGAVFRFCGLAAACCRAGGGRRGP